MEVAVGGTLCAPSQAAAAAPTYRIITLEPLPGRVTSVAVAINDAGVAAGASGAAVPNSRAVLWRERRPIDLGVLPGGDESWATDLNDRDEVVGASTVAGGAIHAFLWRAGRLCDLGAPTGGPATRRASTTRGMSSA